MTDQPSLGDGREHGPSFAEQADVVRPGLIAELWEFMATNKRWWLIPIIVMLLLVGGLIVLSSTAAAPFIYTLF